MGIVHIIGLSLCLDMGRYTCLDMRGICTFNMGLYVSRTVLVLDDVKVGRYSGWMLTWIGVICLGRDTWMCVYRTHVMLGYVCAWIGVICLPTCVICT
jgi:hypothetical protein